MSFQAYIDNIKAKTGKTPEEFKKLAEKDGSAEARCKSRRHCGLVEAGFRSGTRPRHGDLRHVQAADEVAERKLSSRWRLRFRGLPSSTTKEIEQ